MNILYIAVWVYELVLHWLVHSIEVGHGWVLGWFRRNYSWSLLCDALEESITKRHAKPTVRQAQHPARARPHDG